MVNLTHVPILEAYAARDRDGYIWYFDTLEHAREIVAQHEAGYFGDIIKLVPAPP